MDAETEIGLPWGILGKADWAIFKKGTLVG